ncbi:MAG: hypothetical protein MUF84_14385 [Anaerolineae bacterium]|jgi:hypothetical protein|nr:hypothetical protein [Anaerolineae bacterium]
MKRIVTGGRAPLVAVTVSVCGSLFIACLIVVDLVFGTGILLPQKELPAEDQSYVDIARSRIAIGDERTEAIHALSDSWFHSVCTYGDDVTVLDLFFYGPHNHDEAEIVIVESRGTPERATVTFVGLVEAYMLHLYEDCTPPATQAFKEASTR